MARKKTKRPRKQHRPTVSSRPQQKVAQVAVQSSHAASATQTIVYRGTTRPERLSGQYAKWLLAAVATLLALGLSVHGMTNHIFWDDEANTALFARNLNAYGNLTGWDGTNLVGFRLGAELNDELINVYMPPLQYYVAALGLSLFGETTLGGRLLFTVAGIMAVFLLAVWARTYFGARSPWWLPTLFAALTPAYLMYIRQCRYYALSVLFSIGLLAAWSWAQCHPDTKPKTTAGRRRTAEVKGGPLPHGPWARIIADLKDWRGLWSAMTTPQEFIRILAGAACALLLFATNYLNAVAILGALPLFFLDKRYRSGRQIVWLALVYLVVFAYGVIILATANPLAANVAGQDPINPLTRFLILLGWHLGGLSYFEFFPLLIVFLLALPWLITPLKPERVLARQAMLLVGIMIVYTAITAAFSPQPVTRTRVADMRYIVPLILVGTMVITSVVMLLWRLMRPLAVVLVLVLVTSNLLYFGYPNKLPLRSTLLAYIGENVNDYTTGTEAIVDYLKKIPTGSVVQVLPDYMTYSPMFYLPDLHYCCQLEVGKAIQPQLKARLPDYLFRERATPDYVLVGGYNPLQILHYLTRRYGLDSYRLQTILPLSWHDMSRPEIPWHRFEPPTPAMTKNSGIAVLRKIKPHRRP